MKPWCHNRPDREEVGRWVDTGRWLPEGSYRVVGRYWHYWLGETRIIRITKHAKPIYRYRRAFRDINACKAYDVPEGTVPAPVRDHWDCSGCKWLPGSAK